MKKIAMILAALLIFGGGAGWYVFMRPAAAAAADEQKPPPEPDPVYVDLPPLVLPVIERGQVLQVLQITMVMEVADDVAAERVRVAKPRLEDAFVQDLYGAVDQRRVLNGKLVDVDSLRKELAKASASILGEKGFRKILIQRIAQRTL